MINVDVSFNRSNLPSNFSLAVHPDHPTNKHLCTTTKTEFPIKCLFENKSNFTKDSSLSSSYTQSYETNVTNASVCPSMKSLDQSHNSNYSTPKLIENSPLHKKKNIHETLSSVITNSSSITKSKDQEENVKITKAFSLEYTSTTRMTPPKINDCPEIVRSNAEMDPIDEDMALNFYTKGSWQLLCDQKKLSKSDFMACLRKAGGIQPPTVESVNNHFLKAFTARSIQTLPVLILPTASEDKMIETEEKTIGIHEQSQSVFYDEITVCDKSPVATLQKQTQAPSIGKTRTISEVNSYSKFRANFEPTLKSSGKISDTSDVQRGFWGDVYNDYKQFGGVLGDKDKATKQRLQRTSSAKITKTNSRGTSDSVLNGDDFTKRAIDKSMNIKYFKHIGSEASKSINKGSYFDDDIPIIQKFQRCFQVQPFDDIVKSFLTPSDRRVRAVCSRMKCKIRMFGPTSRIPYNSRSHSQSSIHDKVIYHMIIGTNTKERLEKTMKCIQETFPKSCLNEKMIIRQNLEIYGEEIPL